MSAQLNYMDKCLHISMTKIYRLPAFSREFVPNHCIKTITHMHPPLNAKFYFFNQCWLEGIYFMKGVSGQQQEVQKLALKVAVKELGGMENFSTELGISKNTLRSAIYNPTRDVDFKYAFVLAVKSGVDINEISPRTPEINIVFKQAISPSVKSVFLKDIIVNPNIPYLNYCHEENEFILVDENFELISGLKKLRELEGKRVFRTAVKVLNLDDLWNNRTNIYSCGIAITPIRKWEIIIKLVDKYGKGQGFRSDFEENEKNILENWSKNEQLGNNSSQVQNKKRRLKTLEKICKIFNISKFTFYQLNKVCLSEIYPLIDAVSKKQTSPSRAACAVDVFLYEQDPIERVERLYNLLVGEVPDAVLEELKEMARLQGSKAPRLQMMISEGFANEYYY